MKEIVIDNGDNGIRLKVPGKELTAKEITKKYFSNLNMQEILEKEIVNYAIQSNERLKEKIKEALLYALQDFSRETIYDVLETIDSIEIKFE